jgi:hypothetical protein
MASYAAPREPYSSAYDGVATKADGSFDHHIRRVQELHITNGYWCFQSNADGLAAYSLGYQNPESILIAEDRGDGPIKEINLRWMPGTADTYQNPRRGTAKQHLEAIAKERTILGLHASFRDEIPIYAVDSVGKLDQYRREAHKEQTESSSNPTDQIQPQVSVTSHMSSANFKSDTSPSSYFIGQVNHTAPVTARNSLARILQSEISSSTAAPAVTADASVGQWVSPSQSTPQQDALNSPPVTSASPLGVARQLPGNLRPAEPILSVSVYRSPYVSDPVHLIPQPPSDASPSTVLTSPYAQPIMSQPKTLSTTLSRIRDLGVRQGSDGHNLSEIVQAGNTQRGQVDAITTSLSPAGYVNCTINHLTEAADRKTLPEKPALPPQSTPKRSLKSINVEPKMESVLDKYAARTPDMENSPGSQAKTAADATYDIYQQAPQKSHEDRSEQVYKKNSPSRITHDAPIGQAPRTSIPTVVETEQSSLTGHEDELDTSMRDVPLIHVELGSPNETENTSCGDVLMIDTHADNPIQTAEEPPKSLDNIEVFPLSDELPLVEEFATNVSTHHADLPLPSVERYEVKLSAHDDHLDFFNPTHKMHVDVNNPLLVEPFPCMDCGELEVHKYRCNIIGRSIFQFSW